MKKTKALIEFIMEAHNALSAKIAEEVGFKALWASGLFISASLGLADRGDIMDEYTATIRWRLIDTKPGDVILFDSYVPHRSGINRLSATRLIFFFTFNPANEGNFYNLYYTEKRSRPTNPIFHVATSMVHIG